MHPHLLIQAVNSYFLNVVICFWGDSEERGTEKKPRNKLTAIVNLLEINRFKEGALCLYIDQVATWQRPSHSAGRACCNLGSCGLPRSGRIPRKCRSERRLDQLFILAPRGKVVVRKCRKWGGEQIRLVF